PGSVKELVRSGHSVLVETDAGTGIGFTDDIYKEAGAAIISTPKEIFEKADMIVKVKEPQLHECEMLREGQILFTYLHLAADKAQTEALIKSKSIAIAYETVTDNRGHLPLLTPMSEVAGRMSVQVGATCLQKYSGGSGVLLGGVPGVEPGHVVIIGGGVVGMAAARMAMGLEARVTVIDRSNQRLHELDCMYGSRLNKIYSTYDNIEHYVADADLVIGAVLVPGAAAPKLVNRAMIQNMRPGSALVDVAIDQGGCFETSKPTSHANPTYEVDGIVHYCVTNMPGAVAKTAAVALNNATLPYVMALAKKHKQALRDDINLMRGLNVYRGKITYKAVADDLGYEFADATQAVGL
ncbi:MAG: alanine dehydrogenase, partial [Alphaproteobacteria bacterium]|nr:alanine dehydrogenase [Alphaproteobacteria bacterium]